MGQYYKFVNKTRQEESQIALPFNFGMPYAKSLEHYDDDEVEAMFKFVVKHNENWLEEDELVAEGDYGGIVKYEDIRKRSKKYGWENYVPEKVPPRKLEEEG
jgi:hypothetical protein